MAFLLFEQTFGFPAKASHENEQRIVQNDYKEELDDNSDDEGEKPMPSSGGLSGTFMKGLGVASLLCLSAAVARLALGYYPAENQHSNTVSDGNDGITTANAGQSIAKNKYDLYHPADNVANGPETSRGVISYLKVFGLYPIHPTGIVWTKRKNTDLNLLHPQQKSMNTTCSVRV